MNNKVLASVEKNNSIYTNTRNWIIAWSLLLALWLQQAEARTAEEIICPIGMTSDVSASPIVENVEQQTTPNYISLAEAGLKKYYPQYADYFVTTLETTHTIPASIKNKINTIIEENFEIFEDDIITEKDKITTILMFYEVYLWKIYFSNQNDVKVISKDLGYDIRFSAAKEISKSLIKNMGKRYQEVTQIQLEILDEKKAQNEKWESWDNSPETMQWDLEKTLTIWIKLFDRNLIEWEELKNIETIIYDIKHYIGFCNITWKKPSPIGQRFIDEYNKIK